MVELWRADARAGRRDCVPGAASIEALATRFDWGLKSRVAEGDGGRPAGAVIVTSRPSPEGVLAIMDVAGPAEATAELVQWALRFSRAAGAFVAQVFVGGGSGGWLTALGFENARPWWRMDRSLAGALPEPPPIAGYLLLDGRGAPGGSWAEIHNRSFGDHWRFSPRTEDEMLSGKAPELCLMAVTVGDRAPASMSVGLIETYSPDSRPQPVGLITSVGTVPEQRRRGLAGWLVAEELRRLCDAGAKHASLYVDGRNENHAADGYRRLGFELAFEADVWEARLF